jgi:hypothetical protein
LPDRLTARTSRRSAECGVIIAARYNSSTTREGDPIAQTKPYTIAEIGEYRSVRHIPNFCTAQLREREKSLLLILRLLTESLRKSDLDIASHHSIAKPWPKSLTKLVIISGFGATKKEPFVS